MESGKSFSAEKRRPKMNTGFSMEQPLHFDAVTAIDDNSALMSLVHALRVDVAQLAEVMSRHFTAPPAPPPPSPPPPVPSPANDGVHAELAAIAQAEAVVIQHQHDEILQLQHELLMLANSIRDTKSEIVQLRTNNDNDDRLGVVGFELDAVVASTEQATEGILDAAEKIDTISQSLRSYAQDQFIAGLGAELVEAVMTIFEHCNFQDITGQRIRKVVNTLKFVEERVDRMIEIWGHDQFKNVVLKDEEPADHDKKLLNGPQLEGRGVSQADIDKMFS